MITNPNVSRNKRIGPGIPIAGCLALIVGVILQSRTISQLRHENELLRAQPAPAPPEAPSQPAASAASTAIDTEQLQKDRLELLRLRNELRQLRELRAQASSPTAASPPVPSQSPPPIAPAVPARDDEVRQLATAAMQGDPRALDNLAKLAAAARTMKPDEQAAFRSAIRSAFDALGAEAGKGNPASLQTLWLASRIPELQGYAVAALGQAAGQGNEEALKPLLDPESYLLLRSSVVAALKPAADAGNPRAIEALAATVADQKQRPLWYMAANGLSSAAGAGNATAIDSLAALAADEEQNIRKTAVLALEAAARKNQPRAEEALRKLGWR